MSSAAAIAEQVLAALDLGRPGALLDLPQAARADMLSALLAAARDRLDALDLPDEEIRQLRSDTLPLAETVLDEDAPHEAAAVYALEHDEAVAWRPGTFIHDLRLALARFKLGFALGLDERRGPAARSRLLDFERDTLNAFEALPAEEIPEEVRRDQIAKIHERIADHHAELGELEAALARYRAAATCAPSSNQKVSSAIRAANLLERLGDRPSALAELEAVRPLLSEVDDEEDRACWEMQFELLQASLGARWTSQAPPQSPIVKLMPDLHHRWRQHDIHSTSSEVKQLAAWSEEAASECPINDPRDLAVRAGMLQSLAILAPAEGLSILDRADALGADLPPASAITGKLLRAQVLSHQGAADEAELHYSKLWPEILAELGPEERADAAGFRLENLARAQHLECIELICELVHAVLAGFSQAMRQAPGATAPARLATRGLLQRPLETSLLVLLSAIEAAGSRPTNKRTLFDLAWRVVAAAGDPELALPVAGPAAPMPEVATAEDRFHRLLARDRSAGRTDRSWVSALLKLLDLELTVAARAAPASQNDLSPQPEGNALAVFRVRDLVPTPSLVVLWRHHERDGWRAVPDPDARVLAPLQRWATTLTGSGAHRNLAPLFEPQVPAPSPEDLATLAATIFPAEARPGDADPPHAPWDLLLDGPLAALPLESLPDQASGGATLGESFAFRHRLRPHVNAHDQTVNLARGWLGAGVAETGDLPHLAGAESEVRQIAGWLGERGVPVTLLTGGDAVPALVADRLAELRPAVLHLACHGADDAEHPEACCLVLAAPAHDPERGILPLRAIHRLPLTGVDLVVLAACRSATGRSERGAPLRGLAWAFLAAGAAQVLAGRQPVSDASTPVLMEAFYRNLAEHQAAEALRRVRMECRDDPRCTGGDLGTWALWV